MDGLVKKFFAVSYLAKPALLYEPDACGKNVSGSFHRESRGGFHILWREREG